MKDVPTLISTAGQQRIYDLSATEAGSTMIGKPARTRFIAFVAVMSALSNVLAFFVIPAGAVTLHLIQLPIVFAGLAVGAVAGGLVGFFGAFTMAFTLAKPNPYLTLGNAILGFLIGAFYARIRGWSRKPIVPQVISVVLAYVVQAPYVYLTDVYGMGMPQVIVVSIMGVLLIEDLISALISHLILYRIDVGAVLTQD